MTRSTRAPSVMPRSQSVTLASHRHFPIANSFELPGRTGEQVTAKAARDDNGRMFERLATHKTGGARVARDNRKERTVSPLRSLALRPRCRQ